MDDMNLPGQFIKGFLAASLLLLLLVPQRSQSFFNYWFVLPFCFFIKRFSDTTFQLVDTQTSGCRDRDHMSEGYVVLWYSILWQEIREFCSDRHTDGKMNAEYTEETKNKSVFQRKLYHLGSAAALSARLVCLQRLADPSYWPPVMQVWIQAPLCTALAPLQPRWRRWQGKIKRFRNVLITFLLFRNFRTIKVWWSFKGQVIKLTLVRSCTASKAVLYGVLLANWKPQTSTCSQTLTLLSVSQYTETFSMWISARSLF